MNIYEEPKREILNVSEKVIRSDFNFYYENLKVGNLLILGIRQIGKTTLSKQLMKRFIEDNNLTNNEFLALDFRNKVIKENFRNIISNSSKS